MLPFRFLPFQKPYSRAFTQSANSSVHNRCRPLCEYWSVYLTLKPWILLPLASLFITPSFSLPARSPLYPKKPMSNLRQYIQCWGNLFWWSHRRINQLNNCIAEIKKLCIRKSNRNIIVSPYIVFFTQWVTMATQRKSKYLRTESYCLWSRI